METVEMDLMQAQIAELTTEVTRNSRDIAELKKNAGNNSHVTYTGKFGDLPGKMWDIATEIYGGHYVNLAEDFEKGNVSAVLELNLQPIVGFSIKYIAPLYAHELFMWSYFVGIGVGDSVGNAIQFKILLENLRENCRFYPITGYVNNTAYETAELLPVVTNLDYTLDVYFHQMPDE